MVEVMETRFRRMKRMGKLMLGIIAAVVLSGCCKCPLATPQPPEPERCNMLVISYNHNGQRVNEFIGDIGNHAFMLTRPAQVKDIQCWQGNTKTKDLVIEETE